MIITFNRTNQSSLTSEEGTEKNAFFGGKKYSWLAYGLSLLFMLACAMCANAQGVGINSDGSTANASAILDVKSATQGMLAPRMTQAQRNSIATPATGLLIYQTDNTAGFYYYNGSAWTAVSGGGSTDASTLTSGTLADARLSTNVTVQGNTFNGNSQLVKTTAGGALPAIDGANLTSLNGSNISSGTVPTARLGSGTADNTTFLRGDGTWSAPGGGGAPTLQVLVGQNGGTFNATTTTPTIFDWGTPTTNVSSQFNTTTETFTATAAGTYHIIATVTVLASTTGMISVKRNGASYLAFSPIVGASVAAIGYPSRTGQISLTVVLAANDTIQIEGVCSTPSASLDNKGFLYIYKY